MNGAAALLLALLAGCAEGPTERVDEVQRSGFLGVAYAFLREGGEGEAALVYWNESVDFANYDKVMLDPVTIWATPGSSLSKMSRVDRQALADIFYVAMYEELSQDYEIVTTPKLGAMRVRVALTEAEASDTTMDTLSTYVPSIGMLSSMTSLAIDSDTALFVGEASAEGIVTDSVHGVLLAAGVDRRAGTKAIGDDTFESWGDVRDAFVHWARQFHENLKKRSSDR